MENVAAVPNDWVRPKARRSFGSDTAFVLFFLAMDLGRGFSGLDFGELLSFFTIGAFVVFSYFLPAPAEKAEFSSWITVKLFVAAIGFTSGVGFKVLLEVLLMENLNFIPMTFLIFTGILCAITQMRGIIRVRLAG